MEVETKGKDSNSGEAGEDNRKNEELKLGGNIVLVGFSLEPVEMIVAKKIIGHYAKKVGEKIEYQEIKIILKQSQKAQSFLHEIKVNVRTNKGVLVADTVNHNLYTALSEAFDKVDSQAEHKGKILEKV